MYNDLMNDAENLDNHMMMIKNLVIGILDRNVPIDEAIERAVAYHVAMMRGEPA